MFWPLFILSTTILDLSSARHHRFSLSVSSPITLTAPNFAFPISLRAILTSRLSSHFFITVLTRLYAHLPSSPPILLFNLPYHLSLYLLFIYIIFILFYF